MILGSNYTKNNSIYALGRGEIQGFSKDGAGHTIKVQKLYKTNFTRPNEKIVLSLHYNGDDSYLSVNGIQELKFKTKIDQIKKVPLALGNISADWSITYSTETGLHGDVYDFAVDFEPVSAVKTIYDIHRYLMKKYGIL